MAESRTGFAIRRDSAIPDARQKERADVPMHAPLRAGRAEGCCKPSEVGAKVVAVVVVAGGPHDQAAVAGRVEALCPLHTPICIVKRGAEKEGRGKCTSRRQERSGGAGVWGRGWGRSGSRLGWGRGRGRGWGCSAPSCRRPVARRAQYLTPTQPPILSTHLFTHRPQPTTHLPNSLTYGGVGREGKREREKRGEGRSRVLKGEEDRLHYSSARE